MRGRFRNNIHIPRPPLVLKGYGGLGKATVVFIFKTLTLTKMNNTNFANKLNYTRNVGRDMNKNRSHTNCAHIVLTLYKVYIKRVSEKS